MNLNLCLTGCSCRESGSVLRWESNFHNKSKEKVMKKNDVARTRTGPSDYVMRIICPAGKCGYRTDRYSSAKALS